ncbi:putative metallopeptidase [Desulforamulus hydrothermalis]|uniref:Putative phage metallopeptidase domain-containing protein n=1 Tax=Desulforamulus hydrothermalis Lam5 = DSM 18033 TaxID=1121428 RepID=K8DZ24_9FIRM|nr:putative metallopeptidase [Desulforamulus hydrothermalis]CCO08252.1 conserved hypothetical protein [Desulforamulus hydrothermalis Lam5 = DSM 18033]SHH43754.1 hypothetical protein SAMN02745177_02555 [Desulforamulus hydrothermalis Lam5 = DSM 18033]
MSSDNSRIVVVDEWNGKYVINDAYRPIAEALVCKFEELKHVPVKAILFIDNTEGTGKSMNKIKYAQIGKVPEKWQEIIYQVTGRTFQYFMEIFKRNIREMSREQIIALVYHELRHIDYDGGLKHHDIEDWSEMVYGLGLNWSSTKTVIPDLLAEGIDWSNINEMGQQKLFKDNRTLRVIK